MSVQRPTSNVQRPKPQSAQGELGLLEKAARAPQRQMPADISRLELLLGARGQLTAKEILEQWGEPGTDAGKRYVRKLAEVSTAILSYPGSSGYTLIRLADAETLQHAANAIGSQIAVMQAKRVRLHNLAGLKRAEENLSQPAGGAA